MRWDSSWRIYIRCRMRPLVLPTIMTRIFRALPIRRTASAAWTGRSNSKDSLFARYGDTLNNTFTGVGLPGAQDPGNSRVESKGIGVGLHPHSYAPRAQRTAFRMDHRGRCGTGHAGAQRVHSRPARPRHHRGHTDVQREQLWNARVRGSRQHTAEQDVWRVGLGGQLHLVKRRASAQVRR